MARNKYPEETRELILEVSLKLFSEKGYNEVKMQDIVDALGGLTKGAIYHHFKNKEDIFDALLDRYYKVLGPISQIQRSDETGLQKLKKTIIQGLMSYIDNREIMLLSDGLLRTPRFLYRQMEISQKMVVPFVQDIIEQGNADKSLSVPYPKQAAECFALLVNIWINPGVFPVVEGEYTRKILQFKILLDGIGLPVIDEGILEEFAHLRKKISN